ncbi:MAG TPA: class III extradiol ring-cleavage dioxygenase [Thiolinea sp.]|nr:class III extradiol ring-cleavage dioxygenase [Thiolinea sp.]
MPVPTQTNPARSPVLYLPHGGGPRPLMDDPDHANLTRFLGTVAPRLGTPAAILVISAHWEASVATLTANPQPPLYFDYYGFPPETYTYRYPAPGDPDLAQAIAHRLGQHDIPARLDPQRGYDHGLFVPLLLMYPQARIPCLQLSLLEGLDPARHMALGQAIADLRKQNVLIVGSGLSFHNMQALRSDDPDSKQRAIRFDDWLVETCCAEGLDTATRTRRLLDWAQAPQARFCHPREEHLLPLHVCFGAAGADSQAELVFNDTVIGKRVSGFLWH